MGRIALIVLIAILFAGAAFAQNNGFNTLRGTKTLVMDIDGRRFEENSRLSQSIWNNMSNSGQYIDLQFYDFALDWGVLLDQGNLMPDEVVDGFSFVYATDDVGTAGIDWNIYFFDSYTGWGDASLVQEAGFTFAGLPNAINLPPGIWGWITTIDLTASGYEFLMGYEIGIMQELTSTLAPGTFCGALAGMPPGVGGNGQTGTEDAIDTNLGTISFGGNPYATFMFGLYGAADPSAGCSYAGIPLQGNNTALYCVGNWALGSYNNFLVRLNGMTQSAGMVLNATPYIPPMWLPGPGKTLVPRWAGMITVPFSPSYTGDFVSYPFYCGPNSVGTTWYFQGAITDYLTGGSVAPIDLSMNAIIS